VDTISPEEKEEELAAYVRDRARMAVILVGIDPHVRGIVQLLAQYSKAGFGIG